MAVFGLATSFNKKSASQDSYGFIVDQLDILEKTLEADDGFLAMGDYDILLEQAGRILADSRLSTKQRSSLSVKMAGYKKGKDLAQIKISGSVESINKEYKDDMQTAVQMAGNNIPLFLQAKESFLRNKLTSLNETVERISENQSLEEARVNASPYMQEILNVEDDLDSVVSAMSVIENPEAGGGEGLGVYLTTNERGELMDVDVDRAESKSGFAKTSDTANGIVIYGNTQAGPGNKKIIKIGNNSFVQPNIDMSFFGETPVYGRQTGMGIQTGGQAGTIDLSTIPIKRATRTGEWAGSISSSTLYRQEPDGTYTKYSGGAAESKRKELQSLGVGFLPVNSLRERDISRLSTRTIAGEMTPLPEGFFGGSSQAPSPQLAPLMMQSQQTSPQAAAPQTTSLAGVKRTAGPTTQAPQKAQGIAQRTLESAKGLFSGFFS